MGLSIVDSGKMIRYKDKESLTMPVEMCTKVNSLMASPMGMVSMYLAVVMSMKDSGVMIGHMEKAKCVMRRDRFIKANIKVEKCMAMESIGGLMALYIKATGRIVVSMEKENIGGMMGEDASASGERASSMAMLRCSMKMVGHIKEIFITIKDMGVVFTHGPMGRHMMATG